MAVTNTTFLNNVLLQIESWKYTHYGPKDGNFPAMIYDLFNKLLWERVKC